MSGPIRDEAELRALERRVLTRIRRRAQVRRRIVSGAVGVALVIGAVVLVRPVIGGSAGAGGSSGGGSGYAAASSAAGTASGTRPGSTSDAVLCHSTASPTSSVRRAPRPSRIDAASVTAACATAKQPASGLVACRSGTGVLEVFPADGRPDTLCTRDGLTALPTG